MRICPVCPVMEIIVPVDVTGVEQEAVREFRVLWALRDRRENREYRDIREPPVRREQQEPPVRQE